MLYKDFYNWTISTLGAMHHWLWEKMGDLWSWTMDLLTNTLHLDPFYQGFILVVWIGVGVWIAWKVKTRALPDKIMVIATWPALTWSVTPLLMLEGFYIAWFFLAFYAFLGVGIIAMFEVPIHWIFG